MKKENVNKIPEPIFLNYGVLHVYIQLRSFNSLPSVDYMHM